MYIVVPLRICPRTILQCCISIIVCRHRHGRQCWKARRWTIAQPGDSSDWDEILMNEKDAERNVRTRPVFPISRLAPQLVRRLWQASRSSRLPCYRVSRLGGQAPRLYNPTCHYPRQIELFHASQRGATGRGQSQPRFRVQTSLASQSTATQCTCAGAKAQRREATCSQAIGG